MKGTRWDITTREGLQRAARAVLEELTARQSTAAAAGLALHGELGAGKTALVQSLAQLLGVAEAVTSPTFVIMKKYALPPSPAGFASLIHIDAYRLETEAELSVLDFALLAAEPTNVLCIEWAERVSALLPPGTLHADLTLDGETRTLIIRE